MASFTRCEKGMVSTMASVNKVILVGNLGSDPELRQAGDNPVCNFSLATNETWKGKDGQKQERVEWHRIVVWGKVAENCNKYLAKGRPVYIEGKLQTRSWEDKEGVKHYTTEVIARDVKFLGSGGGEKTDRPPEPPPMNEPDADIPF